MQDLQIFLPILCFFLKKQKYPQETTQKLYFDYFMYFPQNSSKQKGQQLKPESSDQNSSLTFLPTILEAKETLTDKQGENPFITLREELHRVVYISHRLTEMKPWERSGKLLPFSPAMCVFILLSWWCWLHRLTGSSVSTWSAHVQR